MVIYSVFIINKSGGLSYYQDYCPNLPSNCSINDYLVLASTFQSIYAITSQISPVKNSLGIEVLESESFKLHCYQTPTGVKFLLIADHTQPHIDQILKRIYELYADYVLKNPFYTQEMLIKFEDFSLKLGNYIRAFSVHREISK